MRAGAERCTPGSARRSLPGGGVRCSPSSSLPFVGRASRPSPGRPPLGAGAASRACCPCVPGGVSGPTACVLVSWRCVPRGWRAGASRGCAVCLCGGSLRHGARPPPWLPVLRAGCWDPQPTCCGRGRAGVTGQALSLWLPACPAGGCVPRAWWEAVLGGVAFHCREGRLVSGAVPPRLPVSGSEQPGAVARVSWVRVVCVWGTQHRPWPPVLRAGCRGQLPTCCGRGLAGVGAQHCPFGLHAL